MTSTSDDPLTHESALSHLDHATPPSTERTFGYLSAVTVRGIRSIHSLQWEAKPAPGWNVILGDNGSGKSTFLRSIAYALLAQTERLALRVGLLEWLRAGIEEAHINVSVAIKEVGKAAYQQTANNALLISRTGTSLKMEFNSDVPDVGEPLYDIFSAGFGPFRRFAGGDTEYEKTFAAFPRAARHLSLFDERFCLTESLAWLQNLRFKQLEGDEAGAALLESLKSFVNQDGFLASGARLDRISSDHVRFRDGNGADVAIDDLSDGYRSILSLTFELIRQLSAHYGPSGVFGASAKRVIAPGIVLIDEVDAHLHPSWQRRIGPFLREHFPALQFIVTTHSPLICQAADVGTVFRLPSPGTNEEARMVLGAELDRLLYGDFVEAYETAAIGVVGRSEKAQEMLELLATLNRKEIDHGLAAEERSEQRRLRAIFPAASEAVR